MINRFLAAIYIAMIMIYAAACAKKSYPETAEVRYTGQNGPGTVQLTALGYGADKYKAEADAFRTAFTTIFYRGLPSADFVDLKRPMFDKQPESEPEFLQKFYADRTYLSFTTSQSPAVKLDRIKSKRAEMRGKLCVEKSMTINYTALRKYLEDQKVLRQGFSY
jgi:hypothetical protein